MKIRMICLASALVVLMSRQAPAQSLSVGSNAPPLTVSRFIKGERVERLEPDQTYVIVFWATWGGSYSQTIPYLAELQKKYNGKVGFIGVSVFENDQSKVEPFVREMGDKMDYSVALDDVPPGSQSSEGKMAKAWMEDSEYLVLPTTFIVTKGKVAYIGDPMEMAEPLAQVVSGKFDFTSASKAAAGKLAEQRATRKVLEALGVKLNELGVDSTPKQRLAIIDATIADAPAIESTLAFTKYILMAQANVEGASDYGTKLVKTTKGDGADALNNLAWMHVAPGAGATGMKLDLKLAIKAATKACDLTKNENGTYLDTLAKAYFDNGDVTKALGLQEKAVKLGGQGEDEMKDRLDLYRKAVESRK